MTAIDLVGLDYYHRRDAPEHCDNPAPHDRARVPVRGPARPAFGAEMGAGFPPFFAPLDEHDSMYALMCALAYGLRGFNRVHGGRARPLDRRADRPARPPAARSPTSYAAPARRARRDRVLTRCVAARPVRLVVPRALRRLARVTHAFGPMTPALFHVAGAGWRETVLERDFGLGAPPVIEAEAYLRAFERALHARGVPFAYAGGETVEHSTAGAPVDRVRQRGRPQAAPRRQSPCGGRRRRHRHAGAARCPSSTAPCARSSAQLDVSGFEIEPLDDLARADALVAHRIDKLGLPTWPTDPVDAHVAVHEDERGSPRVVFVMNPTATAISSCASRSPASPRSRRAWGASGSIASAGHSR